MSGGSKGWRWLFFAVVTCTMVGLFSATGCTSYYNGQTLPSPHYMTDDIQYHPAGPEFKLSREANRMQEIRNEREAVNALP
jgi:hypothetical protein